MNRRELIREFEHCIGTGYHPDNNRKVPVGYLQIAIQFLGEYSDSDPTPSDLAKSADTVATQQRELVDRLRVDPKDLRQEVRQSAAGKAQRINALSAWSLGRWEAEVLNRPACNVHRRTLDTTWRQVYRYATDGDEIPYMTHDELVASGRYSIAKASKEDP